MGVEDLTAAHVLDCCVAVVVEGNRPLLSGGPVVGVELDIGAIALRTADDVENGPLGKSGLDDVLLCLDGRLLVVALRLIDEPVRPPFLFIELCD